MISTRNMSLKELLKLQNEDDEFFTVSLNGREYIIESIGRVFDGFVDSYQSHRCLNISEASGGFIPR